MKKGLELPINMIIVIAIAVLVLVIVTAFFTGQLTSGTDTLNVEQAFTQGCSALRSAYDCNVNSVSTVVIKDVRKPADAGYTLSYICERKGISSSDGGRACARACGCAVGP